MLNDPDTLDPYEEGTRPAEPEFQPKEQLGIIPRTHKRRRTFVWRWLALTEDAYGQTDGPLMSAKQARVFIEDQLTRFQTIHRRFRTHRARTCYFDPLPIDLAQANRETRR